MWDDIFVDAIGGAFESLGNEIHQQVLQSELTFYSNNLNFYYQFTIILSARSKTFSLYLYGASNVLVLSFICYVKKHCYSFVSKHKQRGFKRLLLELQLDRPFRFNFKRPLVSLSITDLDLFTFFNFTFFQTDRRKRHRARKRGGGRL